MSRAPRRAARGSGSPQGRRAGFTLLEMVIVLAVASIIIGGGMAIMSLRSGEKRLREVAGEMEDLARRARTVAVIHQAPYVLALTEKGVFLHPLAEEGLDEAQLARLDEQLASNGVRRMPVRDQKVFDAAFTLQVRRWGSTRWTPLVRGERQLWRFDPNGLCEPLAVRFESDEFGWIEEEYHPLTAAVRESQMEAR